MRTQTYDRQNHKVSMMNCFNCRKVSMIKLFKQREIKVHTVSSKIAVQFSVHFIPL